ncbi:MAG: ddpX [Rickettsiaceae bacterium]|jgi:D-alanyl-D-alanine dipeptidase|nr:ddpX [Rickettsiaceae bacterium]
MQDLIPINKENGFDVELDIRYATNNNVTGEKIYDQPHSSLHKDAAQALVKAIKLAKIQGLRFKIFDAFRPITSQEFLFEKFPDGGFVSNPKTGAVPHCRGVAVDLTLIDESGKELDMGTDFDNFTDLAAHGSTEISALAQKNRYILFGIMMTAGWDFYSKEWWHYQLPNCRDYPIIR